MAGILTLDQDFKEFIQSLNDNDVRYLVVGGYAVAVHGHPRYTKDIDVWLWLDPQNAEKVIDAIRQFGFGTLDLQFEDCYPNRFVVEIEGVSVDFIDLENLKTNKQASGRAQDLADLENLP